MCLDNLQRTRYSPTSIISADGPVALVRHHSFLQMVLATCVWLMSGLAALAETRNPTQQLAPLDRTQPRLRFEKPFDTEIYFWGGRSSYFEKLNDPRLLHGGLNGNPDILRDEINGRLKALGFFRHIRIRDINFDARLKFSFTFEDHDYVIAENNTNYRELSAFRGPQNQTLWIKLFMAVSEVSGWPMTSIEGHEGFDPDCGLSVTMKAGVLGKTGDACVQERQMAAYPKQMEIPVSQGQAEVASASTISLEISSPLTKIRDISKEFFKKYGVEPTIAESACCFVIGAYALKNAVLVGDNRWEKVTFYISNVSQSDVGILTLFVVTDGFYASGLQAPPTESYTTPFEPQHYKQLEEFANRFSEYVRDRMSRRK